RAHRAAAAVRRGRGQFAGRDRHTHRRQRLTAAPASPRQLERGAPGRAGGSWARACPADPGRRERPPARATGSAAGEGGAGRRAETRREAGGDAQGGGRETHGRSWAAGRAPGWEYATAEAPAREEANVVTAIVLIRADVARIPETAESIAQIPQVTEVYSV